MSHDSLSYCGLEPNPQYLQGMPLLNIQCFYQSPLLCQRSNGGVLEVSPGNYCQSTGRESLVMTALSQSRSGSRGPPGWSTAAQPAMRRVPAVNPATETEDMYVLTSPEQAQPPCSWPQMKRPCPAVMPRGEPPGEEAQRLTTCEITCRNLGDAAE